jgi:hypothetical protein
MSEHLIIKPELLYKIYSHTLITDYFTYTFLPDFTSIDIDILYDILNCLSIKSLQSLDIYIYKQWKLSKTICISYDNPPKKRKNTIINKQYPLTKINSNIEFNKKLKKFINNDKVIAIYIMNKLLKFLYPC